MRTVNPKLLEPINPCGNSVGAFHLLSPAARKPDFEGFGKYERLGFKALNPKPQTQNRERIVDAVFGCFLQKTFIRYIGMYGYRDIRL